MTYLRTSCYELPVVQCKDRKKFIMETFRGAKQLLKVLKGKMKQFKKDDGSIEYHLTTAGRIIFVGHTWQIWKSFDSIKDICLENKNLKQVVLFSCSSGTAYGRYTKASKKLSQELLSSGQTGIEVVGFKNEIGFTKFVKNVCTIKFNDCSSKLEFVPEEVSRFVDSLEVID